MDLNKVDLIGRLTGDPVILNAEERYLIAKMGLATNRRVNHTSTKSKQHVDYHSVVMFGGLAKVAQKYLKKGDRLFINGQLQTKYWNKKEGIRQTKVDIITNNLIMLGGSKKKENSTTNNEAVEEVIVD